MTVNDEMRAGRYGPVVNRGRIGYVALAAVEAALGRTFSPEQLAAAGIHIPEEVSND
jgi:hypothetical protein